MLFNNTTLRLQEGFDATAYTDYVVHLYIEHHAFNCILQWVLLIGHHNDDAPDIQGIQM